MKITRRAFTETFSFEHSTIQSIVTRSANLPNGILDTHFPSRSLSDAAYWYIQCYEGTNPFMISLRQQFDKGFDLSAKQLAAALNTMVRAAKPATPKTVTVNLKAITKPAPTSDYPATDQADYVPAPEPTSKVLNTEPHGARAALNRLKLEVKAEEPAPLVSAQQEPAQAATEPASVTPVVFDGTYTIVLNESGEYRTLKVKTISPDSTFKAPQGSQIVSYLHGRDNERDYTGFAVLTGSASKMWKNYATDSKLAQALKILLEASKEDMIDMGQAYALESGRCWRCGRKLTVPASINRGMGPDCAEKL